MAPKKKERIKEFFLLIDVHEFNDTSEALNAFNSTENGFM